MNSKVGTLEITSQASQGNIQSLGIQHKEQASPNQDLSKIKIISLLHDIGHSHTQLQGQTSNISLTKTKTQEKQREEDIHELIAFLKKHAPQPCLSEKEGKKKWMSKEYADRKLGLTE